jgi:hypothetical protein
VYAVDVAGDKLDFLRKTVSAANAHYPERSQMIVIVNVPYWFHFVWNIIKPYVNEKTLKRIKVLSKAELPAGLYIPVIVIVILYILYCILSLCLHCRSDGCD